MSNADFRLPLAVMDQLEAAWREAMRTGKHKLVTPLPLPRFPVYMPYLAVEESDRRAWLRGVKHRLGLVHAGEYLHRCAVRRGLFRWEPAWSWSCRAGDAQGIGYGSQAEAFADAYEHAAGGLDVCANPRVPGTLVIDRRGGAA